jgi:hypothetical protein
MKHNDVGFVEESDLGFAEEPQADNDQNAFFKFLDFIDSVSGAPTRAGIVHGPKAFFSQFGRNPKGAPSAEETAASLGFSTEPIELPKTIGFEDAPPVKVSPAEMAAIPVSMVADWTNLIPLVGPALRGAKNIGKLSQSGALGGKTLKQGAETAQAAQVVRESAPEIKEVAKRLNVPVFEGQLYKDLFTQAAEGVLQTSPSHLARSRQNKLLRALESLQDQARSIVPPSGVTAYEAGSGAKEAMLKQANEQKALFSKLYETIRESTQHIPVSERSRKAISRNVSRLPGTKFDLSPAKSLIEKVAGDINKIQTVDDIKLLRTELNRALSQTASRAEYSAVGDISRRLKALEEGTVIRAAEIMARDTKDPAVKQMILSLIDTRRATDAQYREFMDGLSKLSKGMGKSKIKSSDDAIRFISGLDSEKIANRLFQKNNVEFMQFLKGKHPEQLNSIFQLQKSEILKKVTTGDEINIKRLIKEVNNIPKEIKEMMFNASELNKLEDMGKYLYSMPPHLNPSKTAIAQEYLSFFRNPFAAATTNIRDAALRLYLSGKATTYEDAFNMAQKIAEKGKKPGMVSLGATRAKVGLTEENKVKNKRIKALEE